MKKMIVKAKVLLEYDVEVEVPEYFNFNEIDEAIKEGLKNDLIYPTQIDWDKFNVKEINYDKYGKDFIELEDEQEPNKSDWEANYYYDCMKEGTLYEE